MERVLIVDDDIDFQFTLSNILKDEGFEPIAVGDGREAIKAVEKSYPHLILLDIKLPNMDGIRILEKIKKIDKDLAVIMITGYGKIDEAVKAIKLGAFDYIQKPFDRGELIFRLKKALHIKNLSREVESLKKVLSEKIVAKEMMGESPQIKRVLSQIKIVAPTDLTVILQGESGSGKELIAQMIHQESKRKDKPFVAIDCGAIPVSLAESELFGYEKGAFTGSDVKKEGRFEQANGGTLFLDEITNLSDEIQMKLLRVIQERKLQHLGGKRDVKIDVRVVAATNADLYEAVKKGRFRNDLFHRLNEFHISLPKLRERKEDIPVLVKYFLKEANLEFNKKVIGFSAEGIRFLLNYHWPGNIRELKNLIRKMVLLSDSEYITFDDLSSSIIEPKDETDLATSLAKGLSLEQITNNLERELIRKALEKANNNKTQASIILQIQRKALYRKMTRLGL
jgi:DNA-binding NtrC family response regulator